MAVRSEQSRARRKGWHRGVSIGGGRNEWRRKREKGGENKNKGKQRREKEKKKRK
jgi:hypothetical protein